jgi:four helix bundle protein
MMFFPLERGHSVIFLFRMNYKGFTDVNCYKEARSLRVFISDLVKKLPPDEKYMLVRQAIRSSRSITANIAEGYGRFTYTDTRNFFIMARGSTTETMEHLFTAFDEKYISDEVLKNGIEKCELVLKLINGYIDYLDRANKKGKD